MRVRTCLQQVGRSAYTHRSANVACGPKAHSETAPGRRKRLRQELNGVFLRFPYMGEADNQDFILGDGLFFEGI